MQTFPVPKNSVRQWTEWFKSFQGDVAVLRGNDYNRALSGIEQWMQSSEGVQYKSSPHFHLICFVFEGMAREVVNDWDDFFAEYSTAAPSEVLVQGQPWGYVEELRMGHPLVPGLSFSAPVAGSLGYKESKPWIELVQLGTFSAETLTKLPLSYQTTDAWCSLLELSAEKNGMTWLHALHIGICLAERGDIEEPKALFSKSFELKPNPIAARCLAVLSSTSEEAWPHFEVAWSLLRSSFAADTDSYFRLTTNLVSEMSFFLQQAGWFDVMRSFAETVPFTHRDIDAFITLTVKLQLHSQHFEDALSVLGKNCFPTYAKARDDLMNMWNEATEGFALQKKGGEGSLNALERHRARVANPVPENIGCQYASEVTLPFSYFLLFQSFFHLFVVLFNLLVSQQLFSFNNFFCRN